MYSFHPHRPEHIPLAPIEYVPSPPQIIKEVFPEEHKILMENYQSLSEKLENLKIPPHDLSSFKIEIDEVKNIVIKQQIEMKKIDEYSKTTRCDVTSLRSEASRDLTSIDRKHAKNHEDSIDMFCIIDDKIMSLTNKLYVCYGFLMLSWLMILILALR